VSDCGKYLHVYIRESCQNTLWHYVSLDGIAIDSKLKLNPIIEEFTAEYEYVTNNDNICYMRTNRDAPNFRLVKVNLKSPAVENWVDLIPEHPKDVLDWCTATNKDFLVACYIRDVVNALEIRKLSDGSLVKTLDIPIGSITGFSGNRKQSEIFYYFTSFLTPGIIYHYNFKEEPKVFREIKVQDFDPKLYVTKQIFYESKDGTKVPLFIVHHKDIALNGDNLCLLYGYGGFNISIQPSFNAQRVLFMKNLNGIFALANIRGGGEYGEKWHDSGKLLNKQNVFDDFIFAAQYLIDNRYTNRDKLIIQGGSNGGLLVGAVANQRPDLFGCVICQVG
jgi:prolyl oligopeptidase